jgi:hypothetical protein
MNFRSSSPEPERTIAIAPAPNPGRAWDKTVKHVTDGGLPVNPKVLAELAEKIENGDYRKKPDDLVRDIKKDPGLLLSCLRGISKLQDAPSAFSNPLDVLKTLEDEKLLAVIESSGSQWRQHSFKDASKVQALQYQHTLISSNAAEVAALRKESEPELAFAAAFLREVAVALLAWNYPHVYQKAVVAHRAHGTDIDLELQKQLGITPAQLAGVVAQQLGVSGPLKRAMALLANSGRASMPLEPAGEKKAAELVQIVEVSRIYASTEDTYTYPEAQRLSAEQQQALDSLLPPAERLRVARDVARFLSENEEISSIAALPFLEQFRQTELLRPSTQSFLKNIYVQRLTPEHRDLFQKVYEKLSDGQISLEALRTLTNDVVPALGFARGCVYMRQTDYGPLEPTLRVGDRPLKEYTLGNSSWHQVVAVSADSLLPFRTEGRSSDDFGLVYICAGLGHSLYRGVLFLQLDKDAQQDIMHPSILFFQAIRQTINDCLGGPRIN